jgi:hypothetical protein
MIWFFWNYLENRRVKRLKKGKAFDELTILECSPKLFCDWWKPNC